MSERPHRILVVDDDELALSLVQRVFDAEDDIFVQTMQSATEAADLLLRDDFDVIISDYKMPDMNGLQFLARARELAPRALRILVTAYPDISVAVDAINEGLLYRFIGKPWDTADMRISVRRAAEAKRALEKLATASQPPRSPPEPAAESGSGVAARVAAVERFAAFSLGELSTLAGDLLDTAGTIAATPDQASDAAAHLQETAGRLWSVVTGLRTYAGDLAPRGVESLLDLNTVVQDALARVQPAIDDHVTVRVVLDPTPAVRGVRAEFEQVLVNVLRNAVEACAGSPAATVTVQASELDNAAYVVVTDNGGGIMSLIRDRAFDPFVTTKPGHAGLGLFIARRGVEKAGGTVHIEDNDDGVSVRIVLPAGSARH